MNKSDIQCLIRECVLEVIDEIKKTSKRRGKASKDDIIPSYGELQKQRNQQFRNLMRASGESDLGRAYDDIGFRLNYYVWFWNAPYKELVVKRGEMGLGHADYFGAPAYRNFRGRYDENTKELSVVAPENIQSIKLKRNIIPADLLKELEKQFPGHKLHFFNVQ